MEDASMLPGERMDIDLRKVCRLCLKDDHGLTPISFDQQNGTGASLSHRIMACAQVKVCEGDGLPPNVCASCLSQVDRSYQFKLLCERSDSLLRGNIKSEKFSDDECSDVGEGWDMTKFTPEVIIKEDTFENNLSVNGNGDEGRGSNYESEGDGGREETNVGDSLSIRLGQPTVLDLHATGQHAAGPHATAQHATAQHAILLNGIVFPLPAPLVHLPPPPGPSNKSRRCRSGDKLFKCRQCNKSYSFSSALSRHKAVHNTALRPHVCKVCKKGFTDVDKLLRHEKTHNMDFNTTCDLCHRPFTSYSSFQRHRVRGVCREDGESDADGEAEAGGSEPGRPEEQAPVPGQQAPVAGQQAPVPEQQAPVPAQQAPAQQPRTRESGKGKPEFKCSVCHKLFATRGSLDVHATIHTGVRPFVCSVCHKSFRHKVNLMEHFQRKHSQVRPYICDVCAARFVTKQELVRHYRKHIPD